MTKQPEEGEIWEWRAFGRISEALAAAVHSHPARMALINIEGEDVYFIAPNSDQNIKLRRYDDRWMLKFKLLLGGTPGEAELYKESAVYSYPFPVGYDKLAVTAELLGVTVDKTPGAEFDADGFARALGKASPPVRRTNVKKKRSQFDFDLGWIELAEVWFPKQHISSISIHSPDRGAVERIREQLPLGRDWEVMNYVEACRRWS